MEYTANTYTRARSLVVWMHNMGANDGLFKSGGMNKVVCRFIWLFFVLGVVCANMNGQDQLQDIRIDTFNDMPASVENVTGGAGEFLWDWDKENNSQELTDFLRREIEGQQDVQTIVVNKNRPDDTYGRENATFLVLCRNEEVFELLESIQSIQDRFNHRYNYDWVFLNDKAFDERFMYIVSQNVVQGKLSFGQIPREHWGYPSWVNQTYASEQRARLVEEDVVYADSESYRHMCRFYLGFFYKHPLVAQYQYYWRIEPGVKFYCDVSYDVFHFMKTHGKKYGFVMSMFEYKKTIPSLWGHFKSFIRRYDHANGQYGELLDFVQNDNVAKTYNLCHFWSNFEIADLSIFNNPDYQAFFDHLDATGGFFYERWGDAPVHSLAVLWFLSKRDLWWFGDIGYYHAPYLQCPQPLQTRLENRCSCDPDEDFLFSFISCTPHILNLLNSR